MFVSQRFVSFRIKVQPPRQVFIECSWETSNSAVRPVLLIPTLEFIYFLKPNRTFFSFIISLHLWQGGDEMTSVYVCVREREADKEEEHTLVYGCVYEQLLPLFFHLRQHLFLFLIVLVFFSPPSALFLTSSSTLIFSVSQYCLFFHHLNPFRAPLFILDSLSFHCVVLVFLVQLRQLEGNVFYVIQPIYYCLSFLNQEASICSINTNLLFHLSSVSFLLPS